MKIYQLSTAASFNHVPEHPERTASKQGLGINFDVTYQEWTNRKAMAKTIRLQARRAGHPSDWHACIKLSDSEGY